MAKTPNTPKKPGTPPKSKAHRPEVLPIGPALAELLNPAINRGDAGMGSGTGLQPPPDNSFERRADRRGEHTARKSVVKGFDEAPQRGYVANQPLDINAELRKALGYDNSDPSRPLTGENSDEAQGDGSAEVP